MASCNMAYVILERCEQVVDVIIVFHTAALVSQIYDGVHLLCNHGLSGIGKDACLGQSLQQQRIVQ